LYRVAPGGSCANFEENFAGVETVYAAAAAPRRGIGSDGAQATEVTA
jgi:hypothetical protein